LKLQSKRTLSFFFLSILIGYSQSIAPYYVKVFSKGKVSIIGDLDKHREKCTTEIVYPKKCDHTYRIPKTLIQNAYRSPVIGLGVFIHSVEITCGTKSVTYGDSNETGRIFESLNTYLTISSNLIKCEEDLFVKSWKPNLSSRSGLTSSIAVIGEDNWIRRIKNIVEWLNGPMIFLMAIILSCLIITEKLIGNITGRRIILSYFEPFAWAWIFLVVLMSGIIFDLFLPVDIPFRTIPRLQVFMSIVGLIGPLLFYSFKDKFNNKIELRLNNLVTVNNLEIKTIALTTFALVISLAPNFTFLYKSFLFLTAGIGLATSFKRGNLLFLLFSVAILIDTLKLSMIPYLPVSRISIFYSFFLLLNFTVTKILTLYRVSNSAHAYDLAIQVAHDIRAPLGALKVLSGAVGNSSEEKKLYTDSLNRIEGIANSLLGRNLDFRAGSKPSPTDVNEAIRTIIREKVSIISNSIKIVFINEDKNCVCKLDEVDLKRIVSNTIDNAIQLIPPPKQISVSLKKIRKNLIIEIEDDGQGISGELLETLNNKQYLEPSPSKVGFGLGHSNSKKILSSIGGSIFITSTVGLGTKVKILLPL
jgi:signal transduction histidine kinase